MNIKKLGYVQLVSQSLGAPRLGRCAVTPRQNVDELISAVSQPPERHKNEQTAIGVRTIDWASNDELDWRVKSLGPEQKVRPLRGAAAKRGRANSSHFKSPKAAEKQTQSNHGSYN